MSRPRLRPPKAERVKITAEVNLDLYRRWTEYLQEFGAIRNRFLVEAVERHLREVCPKYARAEET